MLYTVLHNAGLYVGKANVLRKTTAGLNARLLGVSSPPPPPNSLWFGSGLVLAGAILYILNPRAASVAAPAQAEHQKTGPQMSEPTGRLRRVNSAGSRL